MNKNNVKKKETRMKLLKNATVTDKVNVGTM